MSMTPEEQLAQEIRKLLEKIRFLALSIPRIKSEYIKSHENALNGLELWVEDDTDSMLQKDLILTFTEWNIIKILRSNRIQGLGAQNGGTQFIIEILYPKFDEVYASYDALTAQSVDLSNENAKQTGNRLPIFDASKGDIIFQGKNCHIASIGQYQHHVCKELFTETESYKLGDWITETEMQDRYGLLSAGMDTPFKNPTWVKDAVYKINPKILKEFGIPKLIAYGNANLRVNIETFK